MPFAVYLHFQSSDSIEKNISKIVSTLYFLIIGQTLAAIHSVLSSCLKYEITPKIPGPVTESGQLVLILPIATLFFLQKFSESKISQEEIT